MSFYNEYRPRKFADVVGHTRVVASLRHQVLSQMFHHAYLFTGYSGTGKTTCARILAAALCCTSLDGTGEPCGECPSCKGVFSGKYWDFYEMDAARFRGVGDIEEILDKVSLYPLGKHKIYVIDECHMLTELAWNCLLKTLEEPPSYFVIMLCTTEHKKVPETVRSRCHASHFERLTDDEIRIKLQRICDTIGFAPASARLEYAVQTRGNLREAETRLEQVYTEYVAQSIARAKGGR